MGVRSSFISAYSVMNSINSKISAFHLQAVVADPLRIPSDKETINGSYKSVRDGTFKLIFDNGFSWFNSKTLTYKISLYQVIQIQNEISISQSYTYLFMIFDLIYINDLLLLLVLLPLTCNLAGLYSSRCK